ncbi:lactonase family protein [Phyllobacterium sp. 21LDTY02-6]|uniref:lactonase family protein n=1 Tax=Phyllobacterium sp. 21LDTY02-6 TaxID=2944903 RepID=UPI00202131AD|nr:lactonase family protein [Phyllobacterium sp. 21LDTY02-6]MCO4319088.1 lactonase family protein [Phyllobacterium sp. 21LDTY02-6]
MGNALSRHDALEECVRNLYLAVGSLNREAPYFQGARGEGLSVYAFDTTTGHASHVCATSSVDNPTFLSVAADSGVIYANSEVFGWHEGAVSAYRFDARSRELVYLNKQSTQGSISAHNTVTRDGQFVLVANYGMGSGGPDQSLVSLPVRGNGSLAPAASSVRHAGTLGPATDRQERSHPHCVVETPEGGIFLSADLGLDEVIAYRLDGAGAFTRLGSVATAPGAGPRHIAQHSNGRFVYVSNELNSTVSLIERAGEHMRLVQTLPTVPAGFESHGADIHLSPDGRFLYCSNRGHDTIAAFRVDQENGSLVEIGYSFTGGATPRNFTLTPDGNWLLVANQNADCIVIFAIDKETGNLTDTGKRIEIGTPVCVRPFHL